MDTHIGIKFISEEDIVKSGCLNIDEVISVIENAMLAYKSGKIMLPDKISQIFDKKNQSRINCMPATLFHEKVCGVKWVSVFPTNPCRFEVQNVSGLMILSEIETGFPFAVMDGTIITALRTACLGAIGAKYLAKKNSHIYGTIGTGEQAKAHFIVMKHSFPEIDICYVASRTEKSEDNFINVMMEKYPDVEFVRCHVDYDMAAKNADIIVTAVSCQQPLLKAEAIKKGAYYCHVGGWEDEYNVPAKASKIVCDNWEALIHRGSPTIARMYKEGLLGDKDIYADLPDIISKLKPGRENDEEFTYFNAIGLAYVDVAVAYYFYRKIEEVKMGKKLTLQKKNVIDSLFKGMDNAAKMHEK